VNVTVGNSPVILFVVTKGNDLNGSESAIRSRLEGFGFDVQPISGGDSSSADAEGKALVLISSTIGSGSVADKFLGVATPVLNWEAFIQDDMLMTGQTSGQDFGEIDDAFSELVIVDPDHPMAGGLAEGLHEVTTSPQRMMWGSPVASDAQIVATFTLDGEEVPAIYGFDTGAVLHDGVTTAPARRVQFFLSNDVFVNLNEAGLALFDAALSWTLDRELTLPTPEPSKFESVELKDGRLILTWSGSGTLQETQELSGAWTNVAGAISPHEVEISTNRSQGFFRLMDP
jgi:hypothetical protein